ncbi:MAG: hypothetical protein E6J29_13525 [Chloroflexi bacterium]|nr:MAG: hypothetical protein E6J29_13525 [Chloroflexota bacterium]
MLALALGWLALIGLAMNGLGVYASFTDSGQATQAISTGCLRVAFTQVDGKAPADPRSVTWNAVIRQKTVEIVHHVLVTNVCSLPVAGVTISVRQQWTQPEPRDTAQPAVAESDGAQLTLEAFATGPSGASAFRSDRLGSWQAQAWSLPNSVGRLEPSQSLSLKLDLRGRLGETDGGGDVASKAAPSDDGKPPKGASGEVAYTIGVRE